MHPLNSRISLPESDCPLNKDNVPCCPKDPSLVMKQEGSKSHHRYGLPTMKSICSKMKDVSTHALTVPDIDTYTGLMHTLFALEDMYGLKIGEIDGEICLRLDKSDYSTYTSMFDMFHAWQEQAAKLEQGEISREKYDQWRYKYPELDTSKHWAKVPPP